MRILITGAAGMLGTDVTRAVAQRGHVAVALARARLDVSDAAGVSQAVTDARADAVINCAAFTDVDGAESQPAHARNINATGAGHVATAAQAAGAWTIHVSSDYVFDGDKRTPYLESDAVGPRSVYGESKLGGERAVAAAAPARHTVVRTAWLFGTAGSCFPATMLRLAAQRDELSVVDDQVGCPTYTGHLAGALVALAERPVAGILHVAAQDACSWCAFAQEILAGAGVDTAVRAVSTDQFPRPARRPAFSVLRSERGAPALPSWRDGLRDYLAQSARVAA